MAVSEDNKRINVKFTKEEYEIISKLAKEDNRSASNYIYNIVKEYLNKKD